MKVERAASIPLILHDPYFNIWSSADHLYDAEPVHWSGVRQRMRGIVAIDGKRYCFLGENGDQEMIPQQSVDVTPTATEFSFSNEKIVLTVRFTSPLLLDDLTLVSRPCTYLDFSVQKKTDCVVSVEFLVSADLVSRQTSPVIGAVQHQREKDRCPAFSYAWIGKADQSPLGSSGDRITIDWGYLYLATADEGAVICYEKQGRQIRAKLSLEHKSSMIIAYDDLLSINYFGQWCKAYWTKTYATILDAIGAALVEQKEVLLRAKKLDETLLAEAEAIGGDDYAFLCSMSYRHAIAAHKLIEDENGNIIFLSKENDSNGCIGTVDVSYPSAPLFLLYNTEYVKGMLRPVFKFAACDVWGYDFAPHDVGRYPYAWGQVYGLNGKKADGYNGSNGTVYPPFYQYPAGSGIYNFEYQMPVEECGNMLILTAAVCKMEQSADFALPYLDLLHKWMQYLLNYGSDPGEQLCTDDFAGHLSHNVNLSAKAIMGIEAYAQLAALLGDTKEAEKYHNRAADMARDWERRALADDHYMLAFGSHDTWSLKYNLVWDCLFESRLFSEEVFEKELAYYVTKTNTYGTPLDSRRNYTKSDWILWCASMTGQKETAQKLIAPVAYYLKNTTSRVPFSDWYETVTGKYCHFIARSVQGGIFMPVLMAQKHKFRKTKDVKEKL